MSAMNFLLPLVLAFLLALAICHPVLDDVKDGMAINDALLSGKTVDATINSTYAGRIARLLDERNNTSFAAEKGPPVNVDKHQLRKESNDVSLDVTICSHGGTTVQAVITNTGMPHCPLDQQRCQTADRDL